MRKELTEEDLRTVEEEAAAITIIDPLTIFVAKEIQIIDPLTGSSNQRTIEVEEFMP